MLDFTLNNIVKPILDKNFYLWIAIIVLCWWIYYYFKNKSKVQDFKYNEKLEDKKLEAILKLEEKKEFNKTDKVYFQNLIILLWKLDALKSIWNKTKVGTGITVQIPWWEKREIKRLSTKEIDHFSQIVHDFKKEYFDWKEKHNHIFMGFWKETKEAFSNIENFFSHNHPNYSEQDFIKIFDRKNKLISKLK